MAGVTCLSAHFTRAELEYSDLAARRGINNSIPVDVLPTMLATVNMLERVREQLCQLADRDIPIIITSGYRCLQLNRVLGSSDFSHHVTGHAVDWKAPAFGSPFTVCRALEHLIADLGVGQLIHEFGAWVHTSAKAPARDTNRVISISALGVSVGVVRG